MASSFFVNALQVDFEFVLAMEHTGMVVAGTVISFVANRKLALMKDVFAEAFGLLIEVMASFLDIPTQTVVDMRSRFSGSVVPIRGPNKKKEMKMEYHLLHDIVAKALCAKAGSFDMVTGEKFDQMVAITAELKLSVLLERLVKADLGESVKLHTQKVLNNKSVHNYIKKNLNVVPAGESSKQTEDKASGTEGGQSQMAKPMEKGSGNNVQARIQDAPAKSKSGTSSDTDSCPLAKLKRGSAKRKLVV
ncbi:hypothetical protein F511_24136 [Dorcoceras hygrometricum]|uniref:Uncharacterized protein n=1 Tax=Dorcoceras hygrometricum TaxID=472368 RepID=A0A2Z7CSG9_9LAMI|nr:hypothetical protein F511_24136 [Dorcoceras hygrometricum]